MKPYLITMSSHTSGMPRFLRSLEKLGDSVEHLAIQFKPYTENLKTHSVFDRAYPGHLYRYNFIPDNLDRSRHVMFTDTDDVIFQKPLPEKLDYDIYLSPENISHKNTLWERYINFYLPFKPLLDCQVYNCGSFIMRVDILYQYINFLKSHKVDDFDRYNFEQLHFNLFIYKHPEFSKVVDLSLLCPLYNNFEQDNVYKKNEVWYTKNGKVICCVHENGVKGRLSP